MNIIFLSELADIAFIEYMKTKGTVILVPEDVRFDPGIRSHPDLILSVIDDTLVIDPHAHQNIFNQLDALGIPYVMGTSRLSGVYPGDIPYNAVITKEFIIHNPEYTDSLLFTHSKYTNKHLIPVKQGYTKCSTVVVNDNSIITGDPGIYQCSKDLMNVLFIQSGHVVLEGFDTGFLGGASASFQDSILFHGDLSKHPDYLRIKAFVEAADKEVIYFKEFPLTDIGSVLIYQTPQLIPSDPPSNIKKHVNIPIFISHEGCPNDCVFCNQRKITAKDQAMTLEEVAHQITTYSSTLDHHTDVELAFFGGSFTGIESGLQERYLKFAYDYKQAGKLHGIRLSTRPDYITPEILDRLKHYQVDIIELGVQSLDETVLKASNRGHLVKDVYQAVHLIKAYGFRLGIQLMTGLPKDTKERSVFSSKLAALLKPEFIRIYPTLVIKETHLLKLCRMGEYQPLSLETAVDWTKEMYQVFLRDQIPVIRMGLQPTDLIAEGKEVVYGPFHPAFRQLVESSYFLDLITAMLSKIDVPLPNAAPIIIRCNPRDLSQVIGHHRKNLLTLKKFYPNLKISPDPAVKSMKLDLPYDIQT